MSALARSEIEVVGGSPSLERRQEQHSFLSKRGKPPYLATSSPTMLSLNDVIVTNSRSNK